jgi:hypothetical protein
MILEFVALARHAAKALLTPFAGPVHVLRGLVAETPALALVVLVVLLGTAVAAIGGSRLAAFALVPLSGAWLLFNTPFEGPTLVTLSWSHGITAADLISVACLAIAGWRLTQAAVATRG